VEFRVWATKFGPSGLAPRGGCCCNSWTSCYCVWRIWHNIPFCAAMNASTILLGGSGGTSLPLLDTPKPTGELHIGSTIWKNWAFIKYTFISLFSQAEHVRRKLNWNKSSTRQRKILGLRISSAQLKTTRIHDSKFQTNANVWNNLISNLQSKAKVITCGRIWYGGLILAARNKSSHSNTRVSKFSQISPTTQWQKFHLQSDAALKNSRTDAH
jgi:hypothetical protein